MSVGDYVEGGQQHRRQIQTVLPRCRRDMESEKSVGIISLKPKIKVDVECCHCVRPTGWMSGGKEWTGRV